MLLLSVANDLSETGHHWGGALVTLFTGSAFTAWGLKRLTYAAQTFPVPTTPVGRWFLGIVQDALGNTVKSKEIQAVKATAESQGEQAATDLAIQLQKYPSVKGALQSIERTTALMSNGAVDVTTPPAEPVNAVEKKLNDPPTPNGGI